VIRSRRLAFAAAAVIIGLSACGDPNAQSPDTTGAAGDLPKISISSTGGSRAAGDSEVAAMPQDGKMMPIFDMEFVYDGEYPQLADAATAWNFPAGATADQAAIQRIAELFGVQGEVRELSADMGGGWMVGPEDYSGPTITVSTDGMLSWWYSAPMAWEGSAACDDAISVREPSSPETTAPAGTEPAVDPAVDVAPEPICEPAPPEGVPSEDDAKAKASELLSSLGVPVDQVEFEVYADEWSASVTAFSVLDGIRTGATYSVGFGEQGALTWASGYLAEPQRVGDYPLVGCEAGVARLNEENSSWMYPMARAGTYGGIEPASADQVVSSEVLPAETLPVDIAPIEPGGEEPVEVPSEPLVVTLTECRLDRTMVWAADNTTWLLPAYTFSSTDGGTYTVIAIDDSFVEMPDPSVYGEPVPAPDDTMALPEAPPSTLDPIEDTNIDPPAEPIVEEAAPVDAAVAAEALVGLDLKQAQVVADANGWELRQTTIDGAPQTVTMDYRFNRVNVSVEGELVTAVDSIG
jgi:hypothetical protein